MNGDPKSSPRSRISSSRCLHVLFTSSCATTYIAKQLERISWHTEKYKIHSWILCICKEVAVNRKLARGPRNDSRLINSDKRIISWSVILE